MWTRRWTNFSIYHTSNLGVYYYNLSSSVSSSEEGLSAFSSSFLYMFIQFCKIHAFVHFNLFSRHWHCGSLQIRLQVGLHERRFSSASAAEVLDIHLILSIETPVAIIIRTRDIRTDKHTPVTYACFIFGMLVYSYLCMMPFLTWIFLYHTLMILDNINGMWTLGVRHRNLVTVPSFNRDLPMHL